MPSQPDGAQCLAPKFRAERLKGPRRVRAEFRGDAEFAEQLLRFHVARDHQRIAAIAAAHFLQGGVHLTGLCSIRDAELVLDGRDSQGADHHGGERIGELAFEHRAFAGHHAVALAYFAMQKRREHIGEVNLARVAKIAAREVEILRHHAEPNVFRAEDSSNLPQNFLNAQIGARVAHAVVACAEQTQLLARLPRLAGSKHPAELIEFDEAAHPAFENQIHHGREPRVAVGDCAAARLRSVLVEDGKLR